MKISNLCKVLVSTTLLASTLFFGSTAYADEVSTAKEVASKMGDTVVTITVVVKETMSYMGESDKREDKSEVTGTIIDPSGLIVTSLSNINSGEMMDFSDEEDVTYTSEVTDVKIRMPDGKEIAGKIVLRDKDQDLAFIRPAQKLAAPAVCIDLKNVNAAKSELLDSVILLTRAPKAANRVLGVMLDRVVAIIDKPRTFYVIEKNDLGCPVFSADGKVLGICLLKVMPGASSDLRSYERITPVVVPAQDIAQAAAQAPEDAPKEAPATTPKDKI